MLIGLGIGFSHAHGVQTTPPKDAQPLSPGLRNLTGEDVKLADELDKAIAAALKADHWDEAIAKAEELLALRTGARGRSTSRRVAEWRLRGVAPSGPDAPRGSNRLPIGQYYDRASASPRRPRKFAQAQPFLEKALEIRRRLLTDDHPETPTATATWAATLNVQGKYAAAQPLYGEGIEINRRLLTDDHPDTANSYDNLARDLTTRQVRPGPAALREGTGDHPPPAHRRPPRHRRSYNNVADNLDVSGEVCRGPAAVRRRR